MNKLTKEQLKFCKEYLSVIEQIVKTSACSYIAPDYIEGLKEINKMYSYTQCITCNSSIYSATCRLYNDYLYTNNSNRKENKNANKEKSESRKNA